MNRIGRIDRLRRMTRKHKLYLGLRPPSEDFYHYPVIKIVPLDCSLEKTGLVLFTSTTAVELVGGMERGECICVGKKTAESALKAGFTVVGVAEVETQEGVVELLKSLSVKSLFWPRSTRARNVIEEFCRKEEIPLRCVDLYTVVLQKPLPVPNLNDFQEIHFTSPSCVDGFFEVFEEVPSVRVFCIGPVTRAYFEKTCRLFSNHSTVGDG